MSIRITSSGTVSEDISKDVSKDISKLKLSANTPDASPPQDGSVEEISYLKMQLMNGGQSYQILMEHYNNMCHQASILKNENDIFKSQSERFKSQIEELTAGNKILKEKASGNQDDFVDTKQELSDSKEKYQKLQERMYKVLGCVPALSYINPNDSNVEVKVSGKIIGFTYNSYNGKITGARVVVDCEINPLLFAFNQFWLNYDKNIEIENWDKVVIFCPGGLSNVNDLEEGTIVTVKLITNQKPKPNKTPNTIGIIMKE